jgi:hypothetical protein
MRLQTSLLFLKPSVAFALDHGVGSSGVLQLRRSQANVQRSLEDAEIDTKSMIAFFFKKTGFPHSARSQDYKIGRQGPVNRHGAHGKCFAAAPDPSRSL